MLYRMISKVENTASHAVDLLKGMAAVAYIAHDNSRCGLVITSRGAFLILLP